MNKNPSSQKVKQQQKMPSTGEKGTVRRSTDESEKARKIKEAKEKAAQKAKEAKARPKRTPKKKKEEPLEPSPKQPLLDTYVAELKEAFGDNVVEEAHINRPNGHLPTIRVKRETWLDVAHMLKADDAFAFDYLKDLTAYDDKAYMFRRHPLVLVFQERDVGRPRSYGTRSGLGAVRHTRLARC